MELNVYAVLTLISAILLIVLVLIGRKQNITGYLLIFIAITITNLGFYVVSTTDNLETAIVGQKLIYLGAVFTPILLLFCVMKLCKIKVPKILAAILAIYSIVILYFAFNIGYTTDYYTSISLGKEHGMTYLIKEYGPAHVLYTILLYVNVVAVLGVLFYAIFKKKKVSRKVITWLILAEFVTVGLYFYKRIVGDTIEWFTVAYIFDEIIILAFIRKIGMYEVSESIANSLNENSTYGYIVLDNKMRYMGCNSTAEEYLPEILKQEVDKEIDAHTTPTISEKLGDWMRQPTKVNPECVIEKNDKCIKCSVKNLYHGKRKHKIGYIIEFIDNTQQHKYMELMNNYSINLESEVIKKTQHISAMQEKIVLGMADMIENRDSNTGGHVRRTSLVIRFFIEELEKHCEEYGFTKEFLNNVAKAAPMHDLGKIAVDDRVLRKPGKYTPEEFEEMKTHSEKGAQIITQILEGVEDESFIEIAKNVAFYHHEKWNGGGYPKKLSGEGIPVEARIMALADVFDALVSKRCYKEKMNYEDAFKIIEDSLGSHFDPELGKMFLKCRVRLESFYNGIAE